MSLNDGYTFTVGKLDAGVAILIGERASLIEFPSVLLPRGLTLGSVVDVRVTRNEAQEQKKREDFIGLQDEILQMYGAKAPTAPVIRLRGVTQTTIAIEWDALDIAHADLHSLDVVRNGQQIGKIPSPRTSRSTKLSGLDMDTEYAILLILHTSAGSFTSNELHVRTHTLDNMSGVFVCLGTIPDQRLYDATIQVVESLGAQWSTQIQLETTHLLCSMLPDPTNTEQMKLFEKAEQLALPIIQPHWLFACESKKRMVNVSPYGMDGMPPNALEVQEHITRMQKPQPPSLEPQAPEPQATEPQAPEPQAPEPQATGAPKDFQEAEEPRGPEKPVSVPAKDELEAQEKSAPLQDDTVHVWQSESKVTEAPSEPEPQGVQEPEAYGEAQQTSPRHDAASPSEATGADVSLGPDNDMENIDLA